MAHLSSRENNNNKPEYVVILGQGRSGTNWLLDLLDLSPMTYCRNEANELENSPLSRLPSGLICESLGENFGKQWDQAIEKSALQMGVRDRIGLHPKSYLSDIQRSIGRILLNHQKIRHFVSIAFPDLEKSSWQIPPFYATLSKLEEALPIFKLNQVPGWGQWLLANRPKTLVIHIVRHPGGFLNSWKNRYVSVRNPEDIRKANQKRLEKIAEVDAKWKERFGDISAMTVEESELWYWYYANEEIYSSGKGKNNYLNIIYENLVDDPLNAMQTVYKKCHLPCTQEIEETVKKNSTQSQKIAKKWQDSLSERETILVEQFLEISTIHLW